MPSAWRSALLRAGALIALSTVRPTALAPARAAQEPVIRTVRSAQMALAIDQRNGAFVSLADAGRAMVFAQSVETAGNFRLVLGGADAAAATIEGRAQKLTSMGVDGARIELMWAGPLQDTQGRYHQIDAHMRVELGSSAATFQLGVHNRSSSRLQEARYPLVGDVARPSIASAAAADARLWLPTSTPTTVVLGAAADHAFGYPGHLNMAFACVEYPSAGRALYVGIHDPVARYKVLHTESAAIGAGAAVCVQHLPDTAPGVAFEGAPVVLSCVEGGWREASQLYRSWFDREFGIVRPEADWIRRQSFFLMTMFMLPEGTVGYTFRDIPRWAAAARRAGLRSVQISGWQVGGHDNGYPLYEPDPRLGTWEDLERGVRECHRLGLKVFFFVNYQPAMVDMVRYQTDWSKYREMRADGGHTWMAGWGMGTLWARAGHPKLMTWINLAFPEFRSLIVGYFTKLASIGADGVHVDKMFPSAIDHNPLSPLPSDTATWEGAIRLTREIMDACRRINPEWCMSFECNWDRMLQFGGATWWVGNQRVTRTVFPEHVETLAITQAYDYLGINNAVREGHAVMLAPHNLTRGMEWLPVRGLAAYVRQVKGIRDRLQDVLFTGQWLGAVGAKLSGDDLDGVEIGVFRSRSTGLRACVITNARNEQRKAVFDGFDGRTTGSVRVHLPGRAVRKLTLPARISIPAERLAVVEELRAAK